MTTVSGGKSLKNALERFSFITDEAISGAVRITAFEVLRAAQDAIRNPSNGKTYKRGKKVHIASAEGDAPNTDTGRLLQSITVVHQQGAKTALVGTDLDYGAILETEKNRPWLVPAMEQEAQKYEQNLERSIKLQILKVSK